MKGSSNDPSPPAFRAGLVVFGFGKTMLDPPPVSSHRAAPVTNG
jgi:hypothetical protein